jgi:tetratricopeptide (TPR) repeat protein
MPGNGAVVQFACHSEQAFFARRGIWVSREKWRVLCATIIARLARFLMGMLLLALSAALAADSPQSLLAAGRVDQAIQAIALDIHKSPTAESYNLLCRAHFELSEWDLGIPSCEKAVALDPGNGLYHLWLGRVYGEKADHSGFLNAAGLAKKVRAEFERAVELSPDNWEARTDLAEFYVEAPGIVGGGKDKARAQAELLVPLNPGMAHWVRARIAEKNKNEAEAEREYRAAVTASHGGARAWLNLAGFYRHAGRIDDMEQALHSMESGQLDHPGALLDGASLLMHSGHDPALAIRLLRRYIDSSETVEEAPVFKARALLGELLEKQGDRAAAAEQYRAALALAHNFRPALEGLKRVTR